MKPPSIILAAIDFSDSSNSAFKKAVNLAKQFSAELHLFHALEAPLWLFSSYGLLIPPDIIEAARDAVARKLEKSRAMAAAAGVTVTSHLGTGPAADAIIGRAREVEADLIVVGSRGHTGFKRLLLGSVAERTLREAPCAVLAVKRGDVALETFERIVAAVDFSEDADWALGVAVRFARQLDAELHLVHALDVRAPVMTSYDVVLPTALIREAERGGMSRLETLVQKVATEGVAAIPHLTEEAAAPAIVRLAERLGADLIVMGTRGHTGLKHVLLGSVAEHTLRHAPCSVMAVKAACD